MGAKNVHVRVTFPPVTNECHQGIDFRGKGELVIHQIDPELLEIYRSADHGNTDEINKQMQQWANDNMQGSPNVASFGYMTLNGFEEVVGKGCMRCLGRDHEGGIYDGRIRLPPFLRDFTGREYIEYFK